MILQSVQHALKILSLFTFSRPLLGVTDIAKALGISKGAAHNLAHTLEQSGFLDQDKATKKFKLGEMSLAIGAIASGTLDINQKAAGPANALAERTQLLCRVAIWKNGVAIVTLNAAPHTRVPFTPYFGPLLPPYCTVLGKVLLAFIHPEERKNYLERTRLAPYTPQTIIDRERLENDLGVARDRGYAVTREEIIHGRAGIGVPIFRSGGLLAGAIALTGDLNEVLGEKMTAIVSELIRTAAEISRYLGHYPTGYDE